MTRANCSKESIRNQGFKGNTTNGDYIYEDGNMMYDPNKDLHFTYNYLNLPEKVWRGNDPNKDYISWMYDSEGQKFRKSLYLGGIKQYTKDYMGNVEYSNDTLEAIYHSEGRITPKSGGYQYEYYVKDHLGNIRVRIEDKNGDGLIQYDTMGVSNEVLSVSSTYPFGLEHQKASQLKPQSPNPYKYNGKELNEDLGLDLYSYGAREYDAVLGRFVHVDPLADQAPGWSPYRYGLNNPIVNIDPDGRSADNVIKEQEDGSFKTIEDAQGTDVVTVQYLNGDQFIQNNKNGTNSFISAEKMEAKRQEYANASDGERLGKGLQMIGDGIAGAAYVSSMFTEGATLPFAILGEGIGVFGKVVENVSKFNKEGPTMGNMSDAGIDILFEVAPLIIEGPLKKSGMDDVFKDEMRAAFKLNLKAVESVSNRESVK